MNSITDWLALVSRGARYFSEVAMLTHCSNDIIAAWYLKDMVFLVHISSLCVFRSRVVPPEPRIVTVPKRSRLNRPLAALGLVR